MYLVTGAQFVATLGIVEMRMWYVNNWDILQLVNYYLEFTIIKYCEILDLFVGSVPIRYARFGRGVGPIWLDNVHCLGNESLIFNCSHRGLGITSTYCDHSDDVGVQCVG